MKELKPFEFGGWHAWQGTAAVMLSGGDRLHSFASADDAINWLFINGHKDAARALNEHAKRSAP